MSSCAVYHASADYQRGGSSREKVYGAATTATSSPYGIKTLGRDSVSSESEVRKNAIVKSLGNEAGLAGVFLHRYDGEYYLFIVNKNRTSSERFDVQLDRPKFQNTKKLLVIDAATSSLIRSMDARANDWHFTIELEAGGGKLIRLAYVNG